MAPSPFMAIALCLGLLALMVAASRWAAKLTPEDYVGRGLNAHNQGQYELALAEFDRAVGQDPQAPEAFFNRAQTLAKLDRLDAAIRDLNAVIALRRDFPDAYNQRAALYARQEKHALAAADYSESIRQTSYDDQAYLRRADAYHALGRIEDALADYTQALKLNPLDPAIYLNRARALLLAGKTQLGLADYQAAFARGLKDPLAYRERADVLARLGRWAEAEADYSQALACDLSRLPEAERGAWHRQRSAARYELGQYAEALADCDQAQALHSTVMGYLERATILRQLGRYEEALADCNLFLTKSSSSDGYYRRGRLYEDLHDYERAGADYMRALALDPKNAWAYAYRGAILARFGRSRAALADYEQAARLGLDDSVLHFNRVFAYERVGDFETAFKVLDMLIEAAPKDVWAYAHRARLGAKTGRPAKLWRTDFAQALTIESKDARIFNAAAWYLALDGVPAKALALAEQALELEHTPLFRDTRGLALALCGEFERAITDFRSYAEHLRQHDDSPSQAKRAQREQWIAALRAGDNPFTPEVLDALRRD